MTEYQDRKSTRAAQYVRMSTDHQRYSIDNQLQTIQTYAEQNGLEMVRTYADEGRSGLHIEGREGLRQLLIDIQSRAAPFEALVVYDITAVSDIGPREPMAVDVQKTSGTSRQREM